MPLSSILDRLADRPALPRRKKRLRPARFIVETLENRVLLTTYIVTSPDADFDGGDDQHLGLLAAIEQANADTSNSGQDVIDFAIPGTGVQTISITPFLGESDELQIFHPLIIDGTTEAAFQGVTSPTPLIDIDGSQEGGDWLDFKVGGNIVEGLIINNFSGTGIILDGSNDPAHNQGPGLNNIVQGNFIGTDATGQNAVPNTRGGIQIYDSSYNLIGGPNSDGQLISGNLISGNGQNGVFLATATDNHNYIEGNYIGTNITGLEPIGAAQSASYGVALVPPLDAPNDGYASNNFIGDFDPIAHAINPDGINIISGNTADGVLVVGGSGNNITGNYIGVAVDGATPVPNGEDGIRLEDATFNTVGGTEAGSGNVISGNSKNGIEIVADAATEYGLAIPVLQQGASFNKVIGNDIGTDATGENAVPNGDPSATGKAKYGEGVLLKNLATDDSVIVTGNDIGGSATTKNIISGNWDDGILMAGANLKNNTVAGNDIGTDITGQHPLNNSNFGIEFNSIAGQTGAPSGNFIGTTDINGGNLISGNGTPAQGSTPAIGGGIGILNGATANTVQNNLIGTDASGKKFITNAGDGVTISAANGNFIGGEQVIFPNVISGNVGNGISIVNGASGNQVRNNRIGTDSSGEKLLPNTNGVFVSHANGNIIGGASDSDENVIGGNDGDGVLIANAATGNYVEKNSIGVSLDGSEQLPNLQGIALVAATGNYIGNIQTVNGLQVGFGNVISANSTTGIGFASHADSNYVLGNMIGTDETGELNLGNGDFGILVDDSSGNQIGGTSIAARNVIVFNDSDGIDIQSDEPVGNGNSGGNVVEGDYIGIGPDGLKPEANSDDGVLIDNSSSNFVGSGTIANLLLDVTAFNVISDNGLDGVQISGQQSLLNVVSGNYIGLTADGTTAAPNGASAAQPGIELFGSGVVITNGASSTTVGGGGAAGINVISANQEDGIFIGDAGSTNTVQDNYIGTDAQGAGPPTGATTQLNGIVIHNTPGTTLGAASFDQGGNVISGNQLDGIFLDGPASSGTTITGNYIGTDKDAAKPVGNGRDGIDFSTSSSLGAPGPVGSTIVNTTVDANTIAGNLQGGIALFGGTTNVHITNNYVGTNSAFTGTLPNYGYGIDISNSPGNFIGATDAGNEIYDTAVNNNNPSDTGGYGILIRGDGSRVNDVADNDVIHNATAGIQIDGGAFGNVIGETQSNVINSNANGIVISGSGTQFNTVVNNLVGIYPDDAVGGNTHDGVLVTAGATYNFIGSVSADDLSNVISANAFDGIEISGEDTNNNTLINNGVGTNAEGLIRTGFGNTSNGSGVGIEISAPDNQIGGNTEGSGNLIVEGFQGIALDGANATGNDVLGNEISNNGANGILITDGASGNNIGGPNDDDGNKIHDNKANGVDAESGNDDSIRNNTIFANGELGITLNLKANANNSQPDPVLSLATPSRLTGWLQAAPNTTYFIDFFEGHSFQNADGTEDDDAKSIVVPVLPPSSPVVTPVKFDRMSTNAQGVALFDLTFSESPAVGTVIRATVTDPDGDTSEFSDYVVVGDDSTGVGVPDNEQDGNSPSSDNVSFPDALDDSVFINMQADAGAFKNVWSVPDPDPNVPPPDGPRSNTQFGFGFISFSLVNVPAPPTPVLVTITLPPVTPAPTSYWRYGPTKDDLDIDVDGTVTYPDHWYNWLWDGNPNDTGAQFIGNTIILHLIDGALGDDDLSANGTIVDAGSPGFPDPYTVTSTADSGPGSLRQAILNANANPGADDITFDIAQRGPWSIDLASPLPAITDDVTIDGTTQPGFSGTPVLELNGSLAGSAADGLTVAGGSATIKGLVIDRFSGDGIHVLTSGSATIVGNYLGTDASGTLAEGNGMYGVEIENNSQSSDDDDDEEGGSGGLPSTVDGGNIISGNRAGGIFIHGVGATSNFVAGNFIGTQADGISPLGNQGPGVVIDDAASGNDIGFRSADEGNTIAFNAGPGVDVLQGTGNLIEANSIFANGGLGIDLGGDGVTPNDLNDSDAGPNDLQNFPVLTSAASYGGRTFISGTLTSAPDLFYTIDFYATAATNPAGPNQGQVFLGSISLGTDDSGQASFDANLAVSAAAGWLITATASLGSDTSEFSAALQLTATNPLVLIVNTGDDADDAVPDPTHFSLREAIMAANKHPGQDIIDFDLPNLNRVILPQSALPDITDPVIIDGTSQPGYQGLPLLEIDGSQAGAGADGLRITGGGSVVRGLAIHSFQSGTDNLGVSVGGNAIELAGLGGNLIEGDFLGTDVTGTRTLPDRHADLYIFGSPDNVVGGTTAAARNVIVLVVINDFNSDTNQMIEDAGGNYLEGNYIGVDLTGTAALLGGGVIIENSAANTVGGATSGAGNVIAGGLAIDDCSSNIVQGNLIGTDFTGTIALGGGSVAISGQGLPAEFNQIGGSTPAARNVIAGNVIIEGANGSENVVQGNYIGTDITGGVAIHAQTASISGVYAGVDINGAFNQIGGSAPGEGNLVSGFVGEGVGDGILLEASASNNQIQGNLIGTDATGTKPLGNFVGIEDRGSGNLIGGPDSGEGNVISANQTYGLELVGSGGNTVQGNFIGTDRSGKLPLGNGAFTSENDGIYVTGPSNVIGGSLPGDGNVISANGGNGIGVHLAINTLTDASGITLQGNYIGTDVTGTSPLGNGGNGVYVSATPNMVIGGTLPGEGNLISGNVGDGVEIVDAITDVEDGNQSSGAVIQGNKIGTDVTGTARLGNAADGISVVTSYDVASNETVGGPNPGEGNTIAFNGGRGVHIPFGVGNTVRGNDIFANGGPGLVTDINGALSTYAENRENQLAQAPPVLSSAVYDPQGTVVSGTLTGTPFTRYEIDFFANDKVNPTGFGDGQTYLQSISVLTDDTGSAQFQIVLDDPVPIGQWITATATPDTADGNTSMFSQPTPVVATVGDSLQFSSPNYLVTETGGEAVIVVTRSGSTTGTVSVDYATNDGSAIAGTNYTASSGTFTFGDGQTSQTITIPVLDDGLADGDKDFQILLSNPTGVGIGAVSDADVTIADTDSAGQIEFSSDTYPVVDKALGNAVFTVTRTGGSQGAVSVDYRVTGGTGVGISAFQLGESVDADYLDSFGTVTFAPGQTTAQIEILQVLDLIDDNLLTPAYRGPRTIELTLGNPTGGAVLGATVTSTVTIDDEENQHGAFDVPSQLQVGDSEGQTVIEIIRTGQLSTTEEVSYTTVDGTAKAGTNYVVTSGTAVFQPGQTQAFIDVPVLDDHVVDSPGDFRFVLSNPSGGAFIYDGLGTTDVTIVDSDTPPLPPRFEVETNQSLNGDGSVALVTVERLDNASGFAQVDYTTSDGTAKAGTDYQAVSGTLLFGPGQASATFTVPLLANSLTTGDLTFNVTLSNPSTGATIDANNPMPVTLTYQAAGQVQFASPSYPVAENSAELTITVNGPRSGTVDYATHDGTATAGADYTAVSGTISFGQTGLATISIPILNDLLVESNETFSLSLSDPKGGVSLGNPATTTITILDEDSAQIVQSTTTLKSTLSGGSTYGQSVTFNAAVSAGSETPTGSVDFVDSTTGQDLGSSQLAVVNGVDEASVTLSTLNVGSHAIIATYTSDNSNLAGSHDSLTQAVSPATLTVTADNKAMVLGATFPALTDTITGFVNNDTSTVVSGTPKLSTTATSTSPVGSYPIVIGLGTLSSANYTFAFVNGALTVTANGNTPALTLVHNTPSSATEGSLATFTSAVLETIDSDSSVAASTIIYTITIAPTLGTLSNKGSAVAKAGSFSQQDIDDGSVTYQSAEEGTDSFAFRVAAGTAPPITGTLAITASDPAVVATGASIYSATAGALGAAETVATFTDSGGAEALADYMATIDWGDSTSTTTGTISVNPTTHVFTVAGQHNYAAGGTFPIKVTLAHESALSVVVTSTAAITPATGTGESGIAASGVAVSGYEFGALTDVTVATFTDTDVSLTASDFSAIIDWGDGMTSPGSVTLASGSYVVSGLHEYLDEGHYALKVRIEQTAGPVTGGAWATVSATATLHEQLLANGTIGTPDQNYIQEIYRDLFGRQAEMQGLDYWVAELTQGVSRQQVAFQMVKIASFEEFQHDTVAALYQQYLGRAPDARGLAYWSAYLYDGGTIEGMSQALVNSPEYWQNRAGGTAEGFLKALFHDALGRQIEPAALTYFEGLMSDGWSATEVAATVFSGDEYHRVRVNSLFVQFMDRQADPSALAFFAGQLDDGGTDELVISQLLASDEYFAIPQV